MTLLASRWHSVSAESRCPPDVKVVDFGIRGIDLTYALLDGYDAAILVDAAQRGGRPGTVDIIEPERTRDRAAAACPCTHEPAIPTLHDLDPAKVLRLVAALGGGCGRILLVACEPETFGDEERRHGAERAGGGGGR